MTSSLIDSVPLCDLAPSLAAKLEFAILSVLVHHHAEVETTLPTWFVSLSCAFPEVKDVTQIKNFFKHLWKNGLVSLKSPWIGEYTSESGDADLEFLALSHFTVALTTLGVVRWDRIRRYPTPAQTKTVATRAAGGRILRAGTLIYASCSECQALSDSVSEAARTVELSKAAVSAAKARSVPNLMGLQLALADARSVGRVVMQALDAHVKNHAGTLRGKVNKATGY